MTEETITDERTGEIIPKGSPNTLQGNALQLTVNANTIGTLELTSEMESVLDEPLKPEEVKIRPDGLVYLPWTWFAERLNRAFGRLGWGLVPQGSPQSRDTGNNNVLVIWGNWLVVKGVPVGFAVGETSYRIDNYTMSYADAIEGAKSISLARNCKMLGMALQMWDQAWVEAWKKEYAETYKNEKGKTLWRKKGNPKSNSETKPAKTKTSESKPEEHDFERDFPGVAEEMKKQVQEKAEGEKKYTPNQILGSKNGELVKEIVNLSGKTTVEVCKLIGTLDKGTHYTIGHVVKLLTPETGE